MSYVSTAEPAMARNFAYTATSIWDRDSDFREVPASPQRTFMMLFSQKNISACGLLPYTPGRWAGYAPDIDRAAVEADLKELERRGYIVVDSEAEELWVRSFMKWDNYGYRNPKRAPSIVADIGAISSSTIHNLARREFERLAATTSQAVRDTYPQANTLFDSLLDRHGDRHGDRQPDSHGHRPPDSPVPLPVPLPVPKDPPSLRSGTPREDPQGSRLPEPFEVSPAMAEWARDHTPGVDARDHEAFCDYWRAVAGAKGRKRDWTATWRNWMRRENEKRGGVRPPSTVNGRPSTTDSRVAAGLELAERFDAEDRQAIGGGP